MGDQLRALLKPLGPSQHYGIERIKGCPQLTRGASLSESTAEFFETGCVAMKWDSVLIELNYRQFLLPPARQFGGIANLENLLQFLKKYLGNVNRFLNKYLRNDININNRGYS